MSSVSKFIKYKTITWADIERDAKLLSDRLRPLLKERGIDKICAIARGGLVPAALLARELDIHHIDTICIEGYSSGTAINQQAKVSKMLQGDGSGFVIIDEIAETGRTFNIVKQALPKALCVSVYATKVGRDFVDLYQADKADNEWFLLPWEDNRALQG